MLPRREGDTMDHERILYSECPLCDSSEIVPLATVDCTAHPMWRKPLEPTMSWVTCNHCAHVFTEGYFTDAALTVLFGGTQNRQVVGSEIETQRPVSAKM